VPTYDRVTTPLPRQFGRAASIAMVREIYAITAQTSTIPAEMPDPTKMSDVTEP